MKDVRTIKELLLKAQQTKGAWRAQYLSHAQDIIWDDTSSTGDEELNAMLSDLAGDFNFYEPDERDRDESLGYFGDERLAELINNALQKIEAHLKQR